MKGMRREEGEKKEQNGGENETEKNKGLETGGVRKKKGRKTAWKN